MIENTTLLQYSGDSSGTQWDWTPIAYTPPTITGYNYSWTVQSSQVNGASDDVQFNADGYGPQTYVTATSPDHRNGVSPWLIMAGVVAAAIVVAVMTGGAAIPAEAGVLAAETSLDATELGSAELATVDDLTTAETTEAASASADASTFSELDAEEQAEVDAADLPSCAANSFDPQTRVLLADGSTKAIAQIAVGDVVRAGDPISNVDGHEPVTALSRHLDAGLLDVTIARGAAVPGVLHTTRTHSFFDVTAGGWVAASRIRVGDLLRASNTTLVTVRALHELRGAKTMFDLTVSTLHTFYVQAGTAFVLVHNVDCEPPALTDVGLRKVQRVHMPGGDLVNDGKSLFYADTTEQDLDALVEQSESVEAHGPNESNYYERDVYAGRYIGKLCKKSGGEDTKWYRVVQDIYGSVITMHPIEEPSLIPPG